MTLSLFLNSIEAQLINGNRRLVVTKIVIKLTGRAEERFRELLDKTRVDEKDIVLDALSLLHFAVMEKARGNQVAIFDPKTKEARTFNLLSLNVIKS